MSVFPLNIPDKEDHPDKVAKLSGTDAKYYQSAEELNKKRDAINELKFALNAISQGAGTPFEDLTAAMVSPLADGQPFFTTVTDTGQYFYDSTTAEGYILDHLFVGEPHRTIFTDLADATSYWSAQDAAGNTPSNGVLIFIESLKEDYKWDSTVTAKAVETGRAFFEKAEESENLENSTKYSNDGQLFDKINNELLKGYAKKNNSGFVDENQNTPSTWILSSGGSIVDNKVTIKSNNIKARIRVPNTVTIGEKYILLANIEELTALHTNARGLRVYNYTDILITEINFSDTTKIFAIPFTANSSGVIQVEVLGNVNNNETVDGTDLISFNSNFIGCIPWTQEKEDYWLDVSEKYNSSNYENKNVYSALKSEESGIGYQTKSFFTPTDEKQLLPNHWLLVTGGSKNIKGEIVIATDNITSKIRVPNTTTIGEKYIMFAYIDNPVKIEDNADSLSFYNYTQYIFNISLDEPSFNYGVFTSTVDNLIQAIVVGDVNSLPEDTPVCSFTSNCIAVVPYTKEMEDLCKATKENYTGGVLNFSRDLFSYETLPTNSFNTLKDLSSRVKADYATDIPAWNSTPNATNVTNEVVNQEINGESVPVWRVGGTLDLTTYPSGRLWYGFDIRPENYATEDKTYVVVIEGKVTATNIDDFRYSQSSGANYDLAQDLTDGVEASIKTMFTYTYEAGSTENARYTYLSYTRRNSGINDVTYLAEFTTFSIFEEIDGFSIDDYIDASKNGIIESVYAKGYAKKDYVDQKVDAISNNTSKLSPNDFNPKYDVEMGLSGGQSLNVGTGASDNTTDWKNTVTFRKGSSLYNQYFTTEEQKNNFFGTEFVSIQNNPTYEGYPPLTASLNTALSLLESENNVDTSTFGFQFIPLVWGVSGASITKMKKGTTPYADMIECVTKAKEFANKEGKTFGVTFMNWYHGEADINKTKLWYYTEMSQLFIDINTDVKAITGQTEDIEFFTYQTNPWLGRDTPNKDNINIQEAQVQVVRDFANVHLCGAMYQFQYNDFYHPSDRAVVGLQTGVAIKRVVYDNETWNDFIPLSHNVISDGTNFYTHLKFGVPTKPMRFDVSGDIWHNENGKQPNFGFEVLDSGVEQQIAEPFIVRGDTVVLTTSSDPTGMTIRYAVNGSEGGGNLCDSQNIVITNKNTNYVSDNFAAGFSEYLID